MHPLMHPLHTRRWGGWGISPQRGEPLPLPPRFLPLCFDLIQTLSISVRDSILHFVGLYHFCSYTVLPLVPYQSVALGSKKPHQVLRASLDAKRITNKETRSFLLSLRFSKHWMRAYTSLLVASKSALSLT